MEYGIGTEGSNPTPILFQLCELYQATPPFFERFSLLTAQS